MDKIIITRRRLLDAFYNAETLIKTPIDSLAYACKRFRDKTKSLVDKIEAELGDLEALHASRDSADNLLTNKDGRYFYTDEKRKQLRAAKEDYLETEIELAPEYTHLCADNSRVKTLHPSFWPILNGLVFQYDPFAEFEEQAEK